MSCEILDAAMEAKKNKSLVCPDNCGDEIPCPFIHDNQVFPPAELPSITKNTFVLENLGEEEPGQGDEDLDDFGG